MHHKNAESAEPGNNIGLNVKGLDKSNMPKPGDIMFLAKENPPKQVSKFTAMVQVQEHPGQLRSTKDNKGGFTPIIHVRTAKCPCVMEAIQWKMGKSTGKEKQDSPDFIEKGDNAQVTFVPKMPFMADAFKNCPGLGRIAVMDSNSLVMLGKIVDIEFKS